MTDDLVQSIRSLVRMAEATERNRWLPRRSELAATLRRALCVDGCQAHEAVIERLLAILPHRTDAGDYMLPGRGRVPLHEMK